MRCSHLFRSGRIGSVTLKDRLVDMAATIRPHVRIPVIDGGIAGMEAAWVAALHSHEVVLMERSSRPDGLLHVAGAPEVTRDIARLLAFTQARVL